MLFVPAIGPFVSMEEAGDDYTTLLLLSGIVQTAFLFDYLQTNTKIQNINNKVSYHINPNPIALSVTFTYNFD